MGFVFAILCVLSGHEIAKKCISPPAKKIQTFDITCYVPMEVDGKWYWCLNTKTLDNGTVLNLDTWADYIDQTLAVRVYGHYEE